MCMYGVRMLVISVRPRVIVWLGKFDLVCARLCVCVTGVCGCGGAATGQLTANEPWPGKLTLSHAHSLS